MFMTTNILTFDVEEWFQVYNLSGAISRADWDNIPSRLEIGTQRFLDLLDESDCKATCFILGWVARKYPQVVKNIADRGHEIGCHGWDHKPVFDMTEGEFRSETEDAVKALSDATGAEIIGYRASNFSITGSNLWALDILAECGFRYDSSIHPFGGRRYGVAGFPRGPVRLKLPSGREIVEFPLPTAHVFGCVLPVAGGGYLRFWHYRLTKWAIGKLNRSNLPAVVYIHPWELDPEHPRVGRGVSPIRKWMHYYNLRSTEPKLKKLLKDFSFEKMGALYETITGALPVYEFAVENGRQTVRLVTTDREST